MSVKGIVEFDLKSSELRKIVVGKGPAGDLRGAPGRHRARPLLEPARRARDRRALPPRAEPPRSLRRPPQPNGALVKNVTDTLVLLEWFTDSPLRPAIRHVQFNPTQQILRQVAEVFRNSCRFLLKYIF